MPIPGQLSLWSLTSNIRRLISDFWTSGPSAGASGSMFCPANALGGRPLPRDGAGPVAQRVVRTPSAKIANCVFLFE